MACLKKSSLANFHASNTDNLDVTFDLNYSKAIPTLENILNNITLRDNNDTICWDLSPNKTFFVHSCYNFISDGGLRSKFMKNIWGINNPAKYKIFIWHTMHNKILTKNNLTIRGWHGNVNCSFCGHEIEDINHLFFSNALILDIFGTFC